MKTYQDVLHDALEEGSALTGHNLHEMFKELTEDGTIPPPPGDLNEEITDEEYIRLKENFTNSMRALSLLRKGTLKVYIIERKPFDVSRN